MEGIEQLKAWRQRNGLTQKAAAVRLNTTKATISRLETGARKPSLTLAAKLSEKTGIPMKEFVAREVAQ